MTRDLPEPGSPAKKIASRRLGRGSGDDGNVELCRIKRQSASGGLARAELINLCIGRLSKMAAPGLETARSRELRAKSTGRWGVRVGLIVFQ